MSTPRRRTLRPSSAVVTNMSAAPAGVLLVMGLQAFNVDLTPEQIAFLVPAATAGLNYLTDLIRGRANVPPPPTSESTYRPHRPG